MVLSFRPASPNPGAPRAGRPRYGGLAVVIALHAIAIWALSAGLLQRVMPPKAPNPQLTPVLDTPKPPPPQDHPALPPTLRAPVIALIPPPEPLNSSPALPTTQPPVQTPSTDGSATPLAATPGPSGSTEPPAPARRPQPISNGPVCVEMPTPVLPALSWSGQAVLQAQAVVQGGRVVSAEIRVLQGSLDPRTRRALSQVVQTALAGYRCPGEQRFEQEFSFRVD